MNRPDQNAPVTYEYVTGSYNRLTQKNDFAFPADFGKELKASFGSKTYSDICNQLGSMGFRLHTFSIRDYEVDFIFERVRGGNPPRVN